MNECEARPNHIIIPGYGNVFTSTDQTWAPERKIDPRVAQLRILSLRGRKREFFRPLDKAFYVERI